MKQGLLLIDIQNDFFTGCRMELVRMEEAAARAGRILAEFRKTGLPVFHVRHLSIRPGATFFLPDTTGAEIHESVMPQPEEPVITKHFPNSFRETGLLDQLRQADIKELVICGAMSHMCIDATTRAAFDLGYTCSAIEDACASRALAFKGIEVPAQQIHAAFLAALAVSPMRPC